LANDIVDSGDADLVSMSRPFVREPALITQWKWGIDGAKCILYNERMLNVAGGEPLECVVERCLLPEKDIKS
jgi:2,4-dienoyl-CoA reductase-like NADH-dependent reductase (Old Yellow Enzyme family)